VSALYRASADVLIAAVRLGTDRNLPAPDELRERFVRGLQQMVSRCRTLGVPDADVAEAHYALVAFIDDRILQSDWHGRGEWMRSPLQLQIYREVRAGEHFFARASALMQRSQTPPALEIYYLCLALGFTGTHDQNARSYLNAVQARVRRGTPGAPLSPHAVPGDHYSQTRPRRSLAIALTVGCVVVVAFGLMLLWWSAGSTIQRTAGELAARAPTPRLYG
jgi:type VI secretion system protein ImpK